jgi:hypothetical protein
MAEAVLRARSKNSKIEGIPAKAGITETESFGSGRRRKL